MKITVFTLTLVLMAGVASAQRPELVPQTGQGDVIDHTAFSPDGRLLATAGGYTVDLWATDTGRLLRKLPVHTLTPSMAFSPDGKVLVVGEGMGAEVESSANAARGGDDAYQIQFWDVTTGELTRKVKGNAFWISDIAFSADGKWLTTAGSEGEVLLRDGTTGEVIARLREKVQSEKAVWPRVKFSADGSLLAISDSQSTMQVYSVASRTKVHDLGAGTAGGTVLGFTPDNLYLLGLVSAGGTDQGNNLALLNLANGKQDVQVAGLHGAVAVSHDWSMLAAEEGTQKDRKIAFYDLSTGKKQAFSIPGSDILDFSRDDSLLVSANPYVSTRSVGDTDGPGNGSPEVVIWSMKDGTFLRVPKFGLEDRGTEVVAYSVAVGDHGRVLARRIAGMTGGETLTLWDMSSSSGPQLLQVPQGVTANIALSDSGKRIALNVSGGAIVSDLDGRNQTLLKLPANDDTAWTDVLAFSPNEELIARNGLEGKIRPLTIWNRASGNIVLSLNDVVGFAWFPDSKEFVAGDQSGRIQIRNAADGQAVKLLAPQVRVNAVAVSPDGRRVVGGGDDGVIHVWDATLGQQVAVLAGRGCGPPVGASPDTITIKNQGDCVTSLQFSPDGHYLAASGPRDGSAITVWDAGTGTLLYSLSSTLDPTSSVDGKIPFAFSADGRFLIQGTRYITFWDLQTGHEAAILASAAGGDWLVITPDGYFDGSPDGWKAIAWRFGGSTFDVLPVESFYSDFYQPGLLSSILAGNAPPVKQILEARDRRQPLVGIKATHEGDDHRHASIAMHVCQAPSDAKHSQGSGARDLRLFRNGSLVKHWSGDVLHSAGCGDITADVALLAGENNIVAYAFNNDDVKSDDAEFAINGPDKPATRGTAYIIAVGVNKYVAAGMELRYARDDAQSFATEFAKDQDSLHNFTKIVTVSLLDEQATAANFRAALSILTGVPYPLNGADRQLFTSLQATQPEDGVFLFFAGHGTAVGNHFYLLPHDIVPELIATDPERAHAISDADLGRLFEGMDGSHFLVIIDACRSGQALEAEEKRQGAMNSKGLAQLAYEKGMYILTASQAYQSAMEAAQYGHGLLTYALLNGISPPPSEGGELHLLGWLEEASHAVPELQLKFMQASRGLSIVEDQGSLPLEQRNIQQPRLFYRRDPDPYPLLIVPARPAAK